MNPSRPDDPVRSFLSGLPRAASRLLILDYDGTLAPFVEDRLRAVPYDGVPDRLAEMMAGGTRVVIVSGRPLEELAPLVPIEPMPELWGAHGWERRLPGQPSRAESLAREEASELAAAADAAASLLPAGRVERKAGSVAAHVRGMPSAHARAVVERVRLAWRAAAGSGALRVEPFDGGIEARVCGRDKGTAVRRIVAGEPSGASVAYLGDDRTDEDAFRALEGRALTVLVHPEPRATAAVAHLVPPRELLAFFDEWIRLTANRAEAGAGTPLAPPLRCRDETSAQPSGDVMSSGGRPRHRRLVAVSNRLPVALSRTESGAWQLERSAGGLVTALEPLLRDRGGLWIGWPGGEGDGYEGSEDVIARFASEQGYGIVPVPLSESDRNDFYLGFANRVVWPLFHDLQSRCDFDPRYWDAYRRANRKFARVVAAHAREDDLLWVQDYQLMAVAEELRYMGMNGRVGFFLHVPFSDPDIFWRLPWRSELLRSLLQFDLIGFQSARDRDNFMECIVRMDMGADVEASRDRISLPNGRRVRTGVFPVSIDADEFAEGAERPEVLERAEQIREASGHVRLVLGVDRLDYSKGLPQKLTGFRTALERHPELQGRVTLVQLVVPSREDIVEYNEMKEEIERLVGSIHGAFARHDWSPIRYIYGTWEREELLAHYRAADVALVTPLKDGMNLVAKEYSVAGPQDGVLVLSEFAGAAAQLGEHALLVNPFDVEGVADAVGRAAHMDRAERLRRMSGLRETVRSEDIHWWLRSYVGRFEQDVTEEEEGVADTPQTPSRYERRRRERRRYWYSAEV